MATKIAVETPVTFSPSGNITLTLTSLADSQGRVSDVWDRGTLKSELMGWRAKIKLAAGATVGSTVKFYLVTSNTLGESDGNFSTSDAVETSSDKITSNTTLIGQVEVDVASSASSVFISSGTVSICGKYIQVICYNQSGQALSSTSTDCEFVLYKLASGSQQSSTSTTSSSSGTSTSTYALNSATTTVNVSSATAPSSGQVLTATDSTHAAWQTPSGGGGLITTSGLTANVSNGTILTLTHASDITYDRQPFAFVTDFSVLGTSQISPMSSNSSAGQIASASSEYSGSFQAYQAFDNNTTSEWIVTVANAYPIWLQIQLASQVAAGSYVIYPSNPTYVASPKSWVFEGSNNGTSFATLDVQTNITSWTYGVAKTFSFSNSTAYQYYRITISEGYQPGGSDRGLAELKIYSADMLYNCPCLIKTFVDAAGSEPYVKVYYPDATTTVFVPVNWTQDIDITYGIRLS